MSRRKPDIVFLYGWGPEEEGRLSSLFHMAETAKSMNMKATIFFFTDAVVLTKKGVSAKLGGEIARRLAMLIRDEQTELLVCTQALRKRGITREMIEEGMKLIGYATFLEMATSSKVVITI